MNIELDPDSDRLHSCRESLREHMQMVRDRDDRIAELESALHSAALKYATYDPERGIYHGPFATLKGGGGE